MNECEMMQMFIDDNYAFEYILWQETILPMQQKVDDNIIDIEEEND